MVWRKASTNNALNVDIQFPISAQCTLHSVYGHAQLGTNAGAGHYRTVEFINSFAKLGTYVIN